MSTPKKMNFTSFMPPLAILTSTIVVFDAMLVSDILGILVFSEPLKPKRHVNA